MTRTFAKRAVPEDCRWSRKMYKYLLRSRHTMLVRTRGVAFTRHVLRVSLQDISRGLAEWVALFEWGRRRYSQANFSTGRWLTLARCCPFRGSLTPELCTEFTPWEQPWHSPISRERRGLTFDNPRIIPIIRDTISRHPPPLFTLNFLKLGVGAYKLIFYYFL